MEPVFMVLGQSAATVAMHSVKQDVAVQNIDFAKLQTQLLKDGQVLEWTGPKRTPPVQIAPESLPGIVMDDEAATRDGFESFSTGSSPHLGIGYRHDGNTMKGQQTAVFQLTVVKPGRYSVRLAATPHANRATNIPVTVAQKDSVQQYTLNQRVEPKYGAFHAIAERLFEAGTVTVTVSNKDTDGYVLIDGVQLLPVREP
jgi:hypothetical protein